MAAGTRGTVSVVGAHFNPAAPIDLGRMFANETTLRFSIGAPTDDREQAANLILGGDIDPRRIISHRLTLERAPEAYGLFRSHGATKVLLTPLTSSTYLKTVDFSRSPRGRKRRAPGSGVSRPGAAGPGTGFP